MNNLIKRLLLILLLGVGIDVYADTIVMKDGTQVEGDVEFQNDELIRVRVQISQGISETKTFQRSLVEKIIKTAPDDVAFIAVQKMVPTASLLSASDYRNMLEKGPNTFLRAYPNSRHKEDAEEIKAILEAELDKVQFGSVKIEDRWYTADEQDEFKAIYESEVHLFRMKEHFRRGRYSDFISAMYEFEQLENNYLETPAFAKAVPAAQQIVPNLRKQLIGLRRDVDAKNAQWERAKQALTSAQRREVENERKREEMQIAEAIERQKKEGSDWVQVNIRDSDDLDDYIEFVGKEESRISAYSAENADKKSKLLASADRAIVAGELSLAADKMEEAAAISIFSNPNTKSRGKKKTAYTSVLTDKLKVSKDKLAKALKAREAEEKARLKAEKAKLKEEEKKEDDLDALVASRKVEPEEKKVATAPKTGTKAKPKTTTSKPKSKPAVKRKKPISPSVFIFAGVGILVVAILVMKALGIGGKKDE